MYDRNVLLLLCAIQVLMACNLDAGELNWRAGVAKSDITPTEPMRLSGYSNRESASTGVLDPLFVRAMVLYPPAEAPLVLVSIDLLGISGRMTDGIAHEAERRWGVERSRLVISATHTHTGPYLPDVAPNLLSKPLTESEVALADRYRERLSNTILESIAQAIANAVDVQLSMGQGMAEFATNRRVLENGLWKNFGAQEDGLVDRAVRVLAIRDTSGKLLSVVYNYACHATTIPPLDNRISGDWPGISAAEIDERLGIVSLPIIGCGADIGPNPSWSVELARAHGETLAIAVMQSLDAPMKRLSSAPVTDFGYAGLASEHPTRDKLTAGLSSKTPNNKRYSEAMLSLWDRRGVLPETYPAIIHTWQFGRELTWIFLGGEVVLDYAIRLSNEMEGEQVWTSAYCDDVFGYVASERMRAEGGYEVDDSMIYYQLPGRWQSGTEELLIRRVKEIAKGSNRNQKALSADESLRQIDVAADYVIELVASEPLVQDPVNFAFDDRGQLWVVEMRDYPQGNNDGGCIKVLRDLDQNGTMDEATLFLEGLRYPNSVFPYRDGAIVACAPEIFFAADRDGDGVAEHKEVWVDGFPEANPQHRMNGFSYGLEGKLHFSSGEDASAVRVVGSDSPIRASGRDLTLDPESRTLSLVSGPSQFIRSRDDWNRWFGNSNNEPFYQYVIEDHFQQLSGQFIDTGKKYLTEPSIGPLVFPLSSSDERFNDVFSANRFTSACSPIICRSLGCGPEMLDAGIICEPVHNLVHRHRLVQSGSALTGSRFPGEATSEWIRSKDPWFRPVRAETGPDGAIWIADMYRLVIEHPQWIPEAWQQRIDLRAGEDKGRIYRIRHRDFTATALPKIYGESDEVVLAAITSDIGPLRDLAQQWIVQNKLISMKPKLIDAYKTHSNPRVRVQIFATLVLCDWINSTQIAEYMLNETVSEARLFALEVAGLRWKESDAIRDAVRRLTEQSVDAEISLRLLLILGSDPEIDSITAFVNAFRSHEGDEWVRRAVMLASPDHQRQLIQDINQRIVANQIDDQYRGDLISFLSTLVSRSNVPILTEKMIVDLLETSPQSRLRSSSVLPIVAAWMETQREIDKESISPAITNLTKQSESITEDSDTPIEQRVAAVYLMGWNDSIADRTKKWLRLMNPRFPETLQITALDCILKTDDSFSINAMLDQWRQMSPTLRLKVSNSLLRNTRWIELLLSAIESQKIPAADIDISVAQSLRNTWNRTIQTRAVRLLGLAATSDRGSLVELYVRECNVDSTERKSDSVLSAGKQIFQQHCGNCHQSADGQPALGPDLFAMSDRSSRTLLTAILDPNRAVEGKYKAYAVRTVDDVTLSGAIVQESSTSFVIGSADGKRSTVLRTNVAEMKDLGVSLMPEGLERTVAPPMMRSLLAYLQNANREVGVNSK